MNVTPQKIKDTWNKHRAACRSDLEDGRHFQAAIYQDSNIRRFEDIVPSTEVVHVANYWAERHYDKEGSKWWVVFGRHNKIKVACEVY